MTTIEEKRQMQILNYYNEMSSFSNQVQYPNIQFLGIEYINNNPLLRFKLESGKQFRRQLNDNGMYYEHVPLENDDKITTEDKKNIKFTEIKNEDKNEDNIN